MKNFKLLSAFVIAVLFAANTYAQDASGNVAVTAQLVGATTVANTTDVTFGAITQGVAATIVLDANALDPATESGIGAGAAPGLVTISGLANAGITVNFSGATLSDAGSTDELEFTPAVFISTTATAVTDGSSQTLDGSGELLLDIGGSLVVEAADIAASYSTGVGTGSAMSVSITYD